VGLASANLVKDFTLPSGSSAQAFPQESRVILSTTTIFNTKL